MKAAIFRRYGSPGTVVELRDVDTPVPADHEVLLDIRAASVNALDWRTVMGTPFAVRLAIGLRRPKEQRLGVDVAGVVARVGRDVTRFRVGDRVFGNCRGAFAEASCASEAALCAIPEGVSFEQAASIPLASFTAMQALRIGNVASGYSVLVNGAGGGVGTFAVQLAKSLGAHVTGVTQSKNLELVRSIGADEVIDYAREDFTQGGRRYDLILDCHANHSLLACRRKLKPRGTYLVIGAPFARLIDILGVVARCAALSAFGKRKLKMVLAKRQPDDLAIVARLVSEGVVTPLIDRRFPLSEIRDAISYVAEGRASGKVIVGMPSGQPC
jgi:NADPH:quinone reductase-like Zn-dependent oxidoreductase